MSSSFGMSGLYQNKYRISSARLQSWDYASEGLYFVTICTQNREYFFGEVINGEMQQSEIGQVANEEWFKTPGLRPDMNLELGEFVVMPNHIHGIIIIRENQYNSDTNNPDRVSTTPKNQFGPQRKNLASIIRGYKSAVTIYARKNQIDFAWQPRFYEHIIRSPDDYDRISKYIAHNPQKWQDDKFFMI